MPVRRLPENPSLDHLKYRAKDLLRDHKARIPAAAQLLREFHPRFAGASDDVIFAAPLKLSDAQLAIAREAGYSSWARLKRRVEKPTLADRLDLPHQERIEDGDFRRAVELLDAGDAAGLRAHLKQLPKLASQHVAFEGGNYFRNPTLLEFIAENPVRRGKLPENIVEVAKVILDARFTQAALNETLMLVVTGTVPRQSLKQQALIDLLCDYGADADSAVRAAALHGELDAVNMLIKRGARMSLPIAASLGNLVEAKRLLPAANGEDRQLALSQAASYGHEDIVRLMLDAGEDPNRYNPVGGHAHCTPLHQAAGAGHLGVVRLLVTRGARVDLKDVLWRAKPADWAQHEGQTEVEKYLRQQEVENNIRS